MNKELASLSIKLIELLSQLYHEGKISFEVYISNTQFKIAYLESYVKNNSEKTLEIQEISNIIENHKKNNRH